MKSSHPYTSSPHKFSMCKKSICAFIAIMILLSCLPFSGFAASPYNAHHVADLVLEQVGGSYTNSYCLRWVCEMYSVCYGISAPMPNCCAYDFGTSQIDSTSRKDIPVGAIVLFAGSDKTCPYTGRNCGHIAISIGNDLVVHAWGGKIVKTSIDYVISCGYPYRGWGWYGNKSFSTDGTGLDISNPATYPEFTRQIKAYSSGTAVSGYDVFFIQNALNALGSSIDCDGSYGPGTTAAVKSFQSAFQLTSNGTLNKETWDKIISLLIDKYSSEEDDSSSLDITNPSTYPSKTRDIPSYVSGDAAYGKDILFVQTALKDLGYTIDCDGYYGPNATAMVMTFQDEYGIEVTGDINTETWDMFIFLLQAKYYDYEHTHSFGEWEIVSEATCSLPGELTRACECGISEKMVSPATGHSFGEWTAITDATCEKNGESARTCVCGETETKTISATGHKFSDWEIITEASCEEDGLSSRSCSCGMTETQIIKATGHYFGDWSVISEATCEIEGKSARFCACGKTETQIIEAIGHKFGSWTVKIEATTSSPGVEVRVCSVCDFTESKEIPVLPDQPDNPDKPDVPDKPAEINPFVDVNLSDYFYQPVLWAVGEGITSGIDATHFAPGSACTRAQVVTFLWRAAGKPEPASDSNPFEDIKPTDYYYKAVLWAVEKGITSGIDAKHFGPESGCTRAQVATFLWRAQGKEIVNSEINPFGDIKSSAYYYDAVLWAVEKGITTGTGTNLFSPDNICTRGQIVTFISRTYN